MGLSASKDYLFVLRPNALYTPHAWIPRDLGLSLGPSKTTPAPHAILLDTYKVHSVETSCCSVYSVEKLAKHWDLMAPLGSYRMSNSDSSTDHPIICSARSGLDNIL